MSTSGQPLRLDKSDLYSPQVESYLQDQEALRREMPEVEPQPLLVRVIYSSYFYLSIAAGLGGFCAWAAYEPFISDIEVGRGGNLAGLLLFPSVTGCVAFFLGAVEGLMCRNLQRAGISSLVGLAIGFGGGLVAMVPTVIVFTVMIAVAWQFQPLQPGQMFTGFALLIFIMGRAAAWAVAAIPAGMGQGIALREKKVVLNGLLGAVLGGLMGGLLFDPIDLAFAAANGKAAVSRAIGFTVIGLSVGLFVGLVEQWTKTAWLLMKAGALAGKQFVLYRNPTVLGSSPKADIYLFKDPAIEPRHALIHNRGGRFEIEDCGTPDGTYVNGIPIQKHVLQAGDQVVLGKTVLEFSLKETK